MNEDILTPNQPKNRKIEGNKDEDARAFLKPC